MILIVEAPWLRAGQAGPCKRQVGAAADVRDWLIVGSWRCHIMSLSLSLSYKHKHNDKNLGSDWTSVGLGDRTRRHRRYGMAAAQWGLEAICLYLFYFLSVLFLYYYYIFYLFSFYIIITFFFIFFIFAPWGLVAIHDYLGGDGEDLDDDKGDIEDNNWWWVTKVQKVIFNEARWLKHGNDVEGL